MTLANDVATEVANILKAAWSSRDGQAVPAPEDVQLGNDAVKLDGVVLYTDLADSTALVDHYRQDFAAEVYKVYLLAASRVIRDCGGTIVAFDGDRIMAVFTGNIKNSNAAKAALQINWAVQHLVNPAIKKQYPNTSYQVSHVSGIDSSPLFVARTGIRGSNDLVWVGPAANYAAKLCTVRQPAYRSFVTARVYGKLSDEAKYGGNPRRAMWEKLSWPEQSIAIYGSKWTWELG